MKTTSKKTKPAIMLLYVVLFTTATGAFDSMACQLNKEASNCPKETVAPVAKKAYLPIMNPLQILTSKFM